jgi:Uma2 family endonuclease
MNAPFRSPPIHQAPSAPEKHRFSLDDVLGMQVAGILDEDVKRELIGGEVIDMPSEGAAHMRCRFLLTRLLNRSLPDEFMVAPDATLKLSDYNAPEPDIYIYRADVRLEDLTGSDVILAIEIADTSLTRDLGLKNELYARYGVQEFWVIDVNTRRTYVHRNPGPEGYRDGMTVEPDQVLAPLGLPGFSLRLADVSGLD